MKKTILILVILCLLGIPSVFAWSINISTLTTDVQNANNIRYEKNTVDTYAYDNNAATWDAAGIGWDTNGGSNHGNLRSYLNNTGDNKVYWHASDSGDWLGLSWNFTNATPSVSVNFSISGREPNVGQGSNVEIIIVKVNSSGSYVMSQTNLLDDNAAWSITANNETRLDIGDRIIIAYDPEADGVGYDANYLDTILITGAEQPVTSPTVTPAYETAVLEESNTTHSLLFSFYNLTNDSIAVLVYNNTEYDADINLNNGTHVNFSTTVISPFIPVNNSNITFYWNYTINYTNGSSEISNTSEINQAVLWNLTKYPRVNITAYSYIEGAYLTNYTINDSNNSISTTDSSVIFYKSANGTYPITIDAYEHHESKTDNITFTAGSFTNYTFYLYTYNSINFTLYDEDTLALVTQNITIDIFSDEGTSYNSSTTSGYLYVDLLSPATYTVRYSGGDYGTRFYYFNLSNQSHSEIELYCINNSISGVRNVTATVYDQTTNDEVEDVYIKVLRYDLDTNSYIVREIAKTNFEGETIIHILDTEFYKFILEYPLGTVRKITSPTYIYANEINFAILTSEGETADDFFNAQDVTTDLYFNNATNNFGFTFTDSGNRITAGCLRIYSLNTLSGKTLYNSSCVDSTDASILLNVDNATGSVYEAIACINFSSNEEYCLDAFIKEFPESKISNGMGLLIIALLTIVFVSVGYWNLSVAAVITPIPLFVGTLIGLINLSPFAVTPIWALAIVVAYLIGKK